MAVSVEEELLRRRATRYARRAAPLVEEVTEFVAFSRGAGRYALPLGGLREISPRPHLAYIPGASRVVAGAFHFRGELLSAHDLAVWLESEGALAEPEWLLVVEHAGMRLGLLANEVSGIEQLAASQLGPVPITLGQAGACFRGVIGGQVLLLEPERLFSTPAFFRAF
jgi:chemotaxis signal transduction protein